MAGNRKKEDQTGAVGSNMSLVQQWSGGKPPLKLLSGRASKQKSFYVELGCSSSSSSSKYGSNGSNGELAGHTAGGVNATYWLLTYALLAYSKDSEGGNYSQGDIVQEVSGEIVHFQLQAVYFSGKLNAHGHSQVAKETFTVLMQQVRLNEINWTTPG